MCSAHDSLPLSAYTSSTNGAYFWVEEACFSGVEVGQAATHLISLRVFVSPKVLCDGKWVLLLGNVQLKPPAGHGEACLFKSP